MNTDPEQLRQMGELVIGGELRASLSALRAAEGVERPAGLDADALHSVEIAVGHRFGNDLLATWASAIPGVARRFEFTLERVVAHTGQLAVNRAPGDLIGLGKDGDEFLCLEKRRASTDGTELSRFAPGARVATRWLPLAEWIASMVPAGAVASERFSPHLYRAPPTGSSGKRVRHATFGEGRVYTEVGTGPERKVKVDFPGTGLKLLQARFLVFLDEE